MKVIIGLGNPGKQYEKTRHNAGFMVIDKLSEEENINVKTSKFKALIGDGIIENVRVILMKPQTYMNLSGDAVREIMKFYNLDISDIIVISDDISLDVGKIRLRSKGSAGGHNGLKSIIAQAGSDGFARVKVGVGDKKAGQDLANHVLGDIPKSLEEDFKVSIARSADAIRDILKNDITYSMNKYNGM